MEMSKKHHDDFLASYLHKDNINNSLSQIFGQYMCKPIDEWNYFCFICLRAILIYKKQPVKLQSLLIFIMAFNLFFLELLSIYLKM